MKKILLTLIVLFPFIEAKSSEPLHLICKSGIYDGFVEVYLDTDGDSHMIVPESLKSNLSKGDKREITALKFTDDYIKGKWKIYFAVRKTFSINRKTGSISIKGLDDSSFNGMCEKYNLKENKF